MDNTTRIPLFFLYLSLKSYSKVGWYFRMKTAKIIIFLRTLALIFNFKIFLLLNVFYLELFWIAVLLTIGLILATGTLFLWTAILSIILLDIIHGIRCEATSGLKLQILFTFLMI